MFETAQVPEKLIRYLGLGEDAIGIGRVPKLWDEAVSLCRPATFRQQMDIETFHSEFSPHTQKSAAVTRLLRGCDAVTLLVASIGPDLEAASREYRNGHQLFEGYILDRIGSYMAESLMRSLDCSVSIYYNQARCSGTIRYSPGYQDFPLECQKIFAELFIKEISYLRVDPDHRLIPEKTVTAIKGRLPEAISSSQ